jgi:Alpha-2,8-polysialyltransferase (POLYST)
MRGNLFVVSRVGQLRNAQTFIKEHDSSNNHLAVLYTDANLGLADAIESNVEAGLFDQVIRFKQPLDPLRQRTWKNKLIYRQIDDLLVTMTSKRGVENLFLCNSDNYYSLFERVIVDRGLTLTMNLLEEGLGTYLHAGPKEYVRDTTVGWAELQHRGRHVRRVGLQAARSLASLLATFVSWVLRVDVIRALKGAWVQLFVSRKYRYSHITHFDNAYVYFPDKISSNVMKVDHVERLSFVLQSSASQDLLDAIENDEVVFVSQRYIPRRSYVYFSIVFDILVEMGVDRVFFKFHPREDRASFAQAWDQALREHQRLVVLSPPEFQRVPVEELMMAGKVKQVIGLTSTSLMYANAFFTDVDVVSIGARFKELADSAEYDVTKRALSEFNRDLEVFVDASGVRQF